LNADDTDWADLRGFFFNALIRDNPRHPCSKKELMNHQLTPSFAEVRWVDFASATNREIRRFYFLRYRGKSTNKKATRKVAEPQRLRKGKLFFALPLRLSVSA